MHSDMSWHQFEQLVQSEVERALAGTNWRAKRQHGRDDYATAGGGEVSLRVDLHLAESRQGGRGVVLDAKHFVTAPLSRNEVDSTLNYKRRMRASYAILALSQSTQVPNSVVDYLSQNYREITAIGVNRDFGWELTNILNKISNS